VLTDKKDVYNWGNGEYAAFGDGNNKNYEIPVKN
jgi:alpha-tubulin suppressor-like RCC1 family protein